MSDSTTDQRGRATPHRTRSLLMIFGKLPAGANAVLTSVVVAAIGVVTSFATGSQRNVVWWVVLVVLVIVAAGLATAASAHAPPVPPGAMVATEKNTEAVRDQIRTSIKPLLRLSALEAAADRQGRPGGQIAVSKTGDHTLLEIAVKNGGRGSARITGAMIAPMFVRSADRDIYVEEQGYTEGRAWIGGSEPDFAAPDEHAVVWFQGTVGNLSSRLARFLELNQCEVKIDYQDEAGGQQASLLVTIGQRLLAEGDPAPRHVVLRTDSDVREALIPIGFPDPE
jgi:hypothetical protein